MPPRKRKERKHVEEENLDSELSMPHLPMHTYRPERSLGNDEDDVQGEPSQCDSLRGDYTNIAVLLFLYIMQGIPLGLSGSIPLILQSRKVSYREQAMFSFVFWPFSVKLLWAPIVDTIYSAKFGRRKSWLIPTQYLMGAFMLVLSGYISYLLGDDDPTKPVSVLTLTVVFFMLYFLAATQDIAVDGWALTMLSKRNVGWASTCNSIGQTVGYSLGNIVFLALESPEFCNTYLRSEPQKDGLVTLGSFLYFWGIVFIISTTLVWIFKHEDRDEEIEGLSNVWGTYRQLYSIIKLPAVFAYVGILLTAKMGFAAADSITGLKLIEKGVPKEKLALLAVPMVPIQVLLPIVISKYTAGPKPMNIFLKAIPFRLFMGLLFAGIVWWTPSTRLPNGDYPLYYYGVLLVSYAFHQVALYSMFVSLMAFNAKISDPAIGGTYMTLLNTVANLGGNWPTTIALSLVDNFTWKSCIGASGSCDTGDLSKVCEKDGGSCMITTDGYYIESVVCVIIGIVWLVMRSRAVKNLQTLPESAWTCSSSTDKGDKS
ncbi:acetyl-coenzyme A transporter 1-like [Lineus longissimus]|uniref:acetyl-coenzyme A transporter 1-like n=1 Tax=Lineus longissimus TaxID=88925 RepID=UPI002B4DF397